MPKKVTDLEQPVLEPSGLDPVPPDEAPQPAPAAKTKKTNLADQTTGGAFPMKTEDIEAILRIADR